MGVEVEARVGVGMRASCPFGTPHQPWSPVSLRGVWAEAALQGVAAVCGDFGLWDELRHIIPDTPCQVPHVAVALRTAGIRLRPGPGCAPVATAGTSGPSQHIRYGEARMGAQRATRGLDQKAKGD